MAQCVPPRYPYRVHLHPVKHHYLTSEKSNRHPPAASRNRTGMTPHPLRMTLRPRPNRQRRRQQNGPRRQTRVARTNQMPHQRQRHRHRTPPTRRRLNNRCRPLTKTTPQTWSAYQRTRHPPHHPSSQNTPRPAPHQNLPPSLNNHKYPTIPNKIQPPVSRNQLRNHRFAKTLPRPFLSSMPNTQAPPLTRGL